eukprot:TRINITY_DN20096_c0_g2_i1.p1 TRINITY_DN20096_c0_g2~~TRINITY_DN20096_c0_g2_i1.p1  ORF type:complete len:270 (+),score=58.75 TRINITY_DN20096_c0_g2_i1:144-953(+)
MEPPPQSAPGSPDRQPGSSTYETLAGAPQDPNSRLNPGDPGFFLPVYLLEEKETIPYLCMFWWGLTILMTLINYLVYMRKDEASDAYGGLTSAYIAFIIVGMIVYFSAAWTCWYWASKYSTDRVDRKRKVIIGIVALFLFNDMPLWAMDYKAITTKGISHDATLTASFVFNTITFLIGGIVVWLTYAHKMSSFLNAYYSYTATQPVTSSYHTGSVFPERGGGVSGMATPQRPFALPPAGGGYAMGTPSSGVASFSPPPRLPPPTPEYDV